MQIFTLRMQLAALRQLLRDQSAQMTETERLELWKKIETLQDVIEDLEKFLKR